jgi:hypothetical protein
MSKFPLLDKIINVNEKNELKKFFANEPLKKAVKKVLLAPVYYNGTLVEGEDPDPTRNSLLGLMGQSRQLSNEKMGEVLRAQMEALTYIEQGFNTIDEFTKPEVAPTEVKVNEAR